MFRRRDPQPVRDRVREFLSPRKGWQRGYRYLGKRVQRLPDTPHRIALGFACGVMASFTPFFGFHFVIAAAFAFVARGNILASATGTFTGNPLTFPFIAGASMWMGARITGLHVQPPLHGWSFRWLWDNLDAIFIPYLVGGLLPGVVASCAVYFAVRPVISTYQNRRRLQLMERAKQRVHEAAERRKAAKEAKKALKLSRRAGARDLPG
ncbi:hypothetical protein SAMN05444336_101468 [Albimonas donghaensis]|uniref:DUF2062 domain-containing protein n=1 Tax=Albimonas donghaensis TaxID=356660 RepID=A0A1H2RVA1_9RHOB|nr:DUF2062 domain-containing protein [Albimonas donghaensis]SDW23205.1 hypothetical protein SAMN05444336_101468 [Albimonas donghaensis]